MWPYHVSSFLFLLLINSSVVRSHSQLLITYSCSTPLQSAFWHRPCIMFRPRPVASSGGTLLSRNRSHITESLGTNVKWLLAFYISFPCFGLALISTCPTRIISLLLLPVLMTLFFYMCAPFRLSRINKLQCLFLIVWVSSKCFVVGKPFLILLNYNGPSKATPYMCFHILPFVMSCARSFEQSGLATPEKVLFCTTLHLLDQNLFKQFHLDSLFCTTTEDQKTLDILTRSSVLLLKTRRPLTSWLALLYYYWRPEDPRE